MPNLTEAVATVQPEDRFITDDEVAWWAAQNTDYHYPCPLAGQEKEASRPPCDESGRRDDEYNVPLVERITSQAHQFEALDNEFGDLVGEHLHELARLVGLVTQARTVGEYRDRLATLEATCTSKSSR